MSEVLILDGRERCNNAEKSFEVMSTTEVHYNGRVYARIDLLDSPHLGKTYPVVRRELGGAMIVLDLANRLINPR